MAYYLADFKSRINVISTVRPTPYEKKLTFFCRSFCKCFCKGENMEGICIKKKSELTD